MLYGSWGVLTSIGAIENSLSHFMITSAKERGYIFSVYVFQSVCLSKSYEPTLMKFLEGWGDWGVAQGTIDYMLVAIRTTVQISGSRVPGLGLRLGSRVFYSLLRFL